MKKIYLVLLILSSNKLIGQIVIIKDSLLNTNIENVTLIFEDLGIISERDGLADISMFSDNSIIEFSHVAYKSRRITKKKIRKIIYLQPKSNILPTINLNEEIKIPLSEKYPLFTIRSKGGAQLESSIADLLSSKSSVVVQESQSGGGSPNYRGMEANRLLLVVDDVPLNNAIYRSGHLQNSSTINPFLIESIMLLSGPASTGYGNGAMGGALVFNTKNPTNKKNIHFYQQYESNSKTIATNFQVNYFRNKFSHITAFSLKKAGNSKMGKKRFHGYENWGNESGATNMNEQLYTNYVQGDFMHKSKYRINEKNYVLFNTQYSRSSIIYRFDKMNDIQNGSRKYAKWYYGPQIRFLQTINYKLEYRTIAFDNIKTTLALQNIQESRHIQKYEEQLLNNRNENVKIYDFNIDFTKKIFDLKLAYGVGLRHQKVASKASLTNGNTVFYNTTRYPDGGSSIKELFAYTQVNLRLSRKIDLLLGLRLNKSKLQAKFNKTDFGFSDLENKNTSFIKSALLSYKPIAKTIVNASYYSGFRNPNIDDIGKVFSKDGINVVIPNAELEPEYANNFELSLNYSLNPMKIQIQIFTTKITNAIRRGFGNINDYDSIYYDGEIMRIQMNKNIENALINGVSLTTYFTSRDDLVITFSCNYLKGLANDKSPLAHIPPFNAKLSLNYKLRKHIIDYYTNYNAWKLSIDYDEAGVDNLEEATIDGSPSWFTHNIAYSNKIDKNITIHFAIKNILDAHYKTFSSGISGSGRNFIMALKAAF